MMNFCYTNLEENEFQFCWKIRKFSVRLKCAKTRQAVTILESEPFSVGVEDKTDWCLKLYFGGKNEKDYKDFIGLFLCSTSVEDKKEILALLNFSTDFLPEGKFSSVNFCKFNRTNPDWGCGKFLAIEKVTEIYLPSDELTIYCRVKVIGRTTSHVEELRVAEKTKVLKLAKDFESLLKNEKFADITFIVNDKKFKAHKNILSARSPVFAAMFEAAMTEAENNEVKIEDIKSEVFDKMLRYIYTGDVSDIDGMSTDLLAAADKYELIGLMETCENSLCKAITFGNAAETLVIADRHNAKNLLEYIYNFIDHNKADVIATPGYEMMKKKYPQLSVKLVFRLVEGPKIISDEK